MADKVTQLAGEIKRAHPNMSHDQVKKKAAEAFRRAERRNPKK